MPIPLQVGLGLWMAGVIAAAFLYLPPAKGFTSPEWARMIVFHVPCAILAVIAYLVSSVYAMGLLAGGKPISDAKSAISAGLGFLFTAFATVTGMVFARTQWGSAWNWDPRETSILMLLLVYAAYFALRGAIPAVATRARISAAYNLLACVVMPYLVFILPRVMGGLHPSGTLTSRGGLSAEYRIVLAAGTIGFIWLYVWLFRARTRIAERRLACDEAECAPRREE